MIGDGSVVNGKVMEKGRWDGAAVSVRNAMRYHEVVRKFTTATYCGSRMVNFSTKFITSEATAVPKWVTLSERGSRV